MSERIHPMEHKPSKDRVLCFWNLFGGGYPCANPGVGPRAMKTGNSSDAWTWCAAHGGVAPTSPTSVPVQDLKQEPEKP